MLAKLNEVLQVDLGTDERTYMDNVVQWEQWIHEFETMSREMLSDIVKRAIVTEKSPSAIRTHLLVNAQNLDTSKEANDIVANSRTNPLLGVAKTAETT